MTIMTTLIGQKETTEKITLQLHCDKGAYIFKMYKQFTEGLVEIFIYRAEVQYYCTLNVFSSEDMQNLNKMFYTANHIYSHFDEYIHQLTP